MLVYAKIKLVQEKISSLQKETSIGFVPTMGALHKGHISLLEQAKKENDFVVVSIFVNPTQFDNQEDLHNYPSTMEADLALLKEASCDLVFTPNVSEMYQNNVASVLFDFDGLEHQMEGKFRSGHFDGVGTVVSQLFDIVKPNRAYFGEKDFQQLQIIKNLVKKKDIPVQIIACEIYRENDGLAMSSRNIRLSEAQRKEAPRIYKILQEVQSKFQDESILDISIWVEKEFQKIPLLELEYFEIANDKTLESSKKKDPNQKYRAFIAVFAGDVRLIDNISL
jgi:pantoate--beta-alanine ligase